MPLSFIGELGLQTLVDQFDKVGIFGMAICTNRQGWKESQRDITVERWTGSGPERHRAPAIWSEPCAGD